MEWCYITETFFEIAGKTVASSLRVDKKKGPPVGNPGMQLGALDYAMRTLYQLLARSPCREVFKAKYNRADSTGFPTPWWTGLLLAW
jgi:hypothetical protein